VRVLRVSAAELVAALVDERYDAFRIGWAEVRPQDAADPVRVVLRAPGPIDPPLLSAAPLLLVLQCGDLTDAPGSLRSLA
jgi:hypothetical protein